MKRSLSVLCIGFSALLGVVTSSTAQAQDLVFEETDLLEDFDWADDFGCHEDFDLEDFEGDEASVEYSKYYERFGPTTLMWADACIALQKEKDKLRKMIKLEEQVHKNAKESGDAAAEFQAFANLELYNGRLDATESALDACREMFSQFFN